MAVLNSYDIDNKNKEQKFMREKNRKKGIGKKLISFMLAVVIMATSVQLNAFAEEITNVPLEISEEEIQEMESEIYESLEAEAAEEYPEDMTPEEYAEWKAAYMESMQEDELILTDADGARSVAGGYIRNDIIEAYVKGDGKFTIGTVNGSKMVTDNHKKLLYGHPSPWSSVTSIKLDGSNHTFTGQTNWVETRDAIMVSHMIDNVVTTQSLSIVENEYTGEADTIAITYTMTNYDDVNHEVGIRIMMDTMLGSNDGSPFRVPGHGNVTKELELTGSNIPQNWMTFDSLDNPKIIANGCFYRNLDEKPDKVQFAAWGSIHGTSWDYTTSSSRAVTGDSAVAAYYNPKTLEPGESRTITTYYGIGSFSVSDAKPPLSVSVAAPAELKANMEEGGYNHNPFSVIAYIQNNGNGAATNVKAQLNLPKDGSIQLISPASLEQTMGDVGVGEEVAVTWLVYAEGQAKKKTAKYSITVSADNEAAKSVDVSTILPETKVEVENFTVKLNKTKVELDVDGTYYTQLKAECSDGKKRNVTWLSTNSSVAKVDDKGMVKAISGGKAKIIAAVGSKNAICEVEVKGSSNPLQKLELSETSVSMSIGQVKQLVERYTPTTVFQKGVKWSSSNPAVAKVNENGRVEAIANGTAQIKAVYNADSNKYAVCTVQVGSAAQNVAINQNIGFSETLYGPKISILGKTFNMFKIPMSMELKLNEAISLEYNEEEKSFTGTFGLAGDDTLTNPDGYKNDYTKIKKAGDLLKKKGPKGFLKTYGKMMKNKKTAPVYFQKGTIRTFGSVKYQQVNGTYKFAEGQLYVVMTWDDIFTIKYNIPACPVVYFKFNIAGDVHGGLKLEAEEYGVNDLGNLKPTGTIGAQLDLSGGVGADILIAGLEGGLTGSLNIDLNNIPNVVPSRDLEVKIAASLYAKAKALFFLEFNDSWEFASVQLLPRVENDATMANALSLNSDEFITMQENVESMDLMYAFDSIYDIQQLENTGYAYNEPQMVRLSDGRIFAVWCDNVEGRSEFDRTGIYYSIYEDASWSEPALVDDDGTADFSPVIAADRNNVYIAWQNMDQEFGSQAEMDAMMPLTGIKMACYKDGAITDVKVLSEAEDNYDAAPRIAAAGDEVSVVWCNNEANDWTLYEGTNTLKQYTASMEGEEVISLYSEEKIITSYDTAYQNEQLVTVFNADQDGDFETFNTSEVYIDGVENEELSSAVSGRQLMFAQKDSSTDLYWWDGTAIKSMRNLDASDIEDCYMTPGAIDFNVSSCGEKDIIYWTQTDGTYSVLKAVLKNGEEESWCYPVELYDFDGVIRDPAVIMDSEEDIQILTNFVYLDEEHNDDSVALAYLEVPSTADIQIIGEPDFNEFEVVSEADLEINAEIKNNGTKAVNSFIIRLMEGNGKIITTKEISEPLVPGETKTINVLYTLPANMTYHNVIMQVVPRNMADANMSDNETNVYIGKADVVVSDVKVSGVGENRRVFVEVSNKGYQQAENINVFVTSKTEDGSVLGSAQLEVLEGRSKRNISFDVPLSGLDFEDESGMLIYAQLTNGEETVRDEAKMSSVILNPEEEDTVTIGTGAYDNSKLILNLYNNVDREVTADLYVELMDHDDTIFSLGQEITLEPYAVQTSQFDLKSLLIYPHDRICTYLMDDNGKILSNRTYLNSQSVMVDEFDLLLDKERLILKKGDTVNLKSRLSILDWELADLVWTSSDEDVVTVDYDGNVTAVGEGNATITIGSSILGLNAECKVMVVDETPLDDFIDSALRTNNITVDMAKDSGALIQFTSIYDQNASDVMLDAMEVSENSEFESAVTESLILEDDAVRELFEVQLIDDATAIIVPTAKAANSKEYINKTYKTDVSLKLKGSDEKIEIGELAIKTISTLPQVTASAGKIDCYYSNASTEVILKSKGKLLENVVSVSVDPVADSKNNKNPEYFTYDNENQTLTISEDYKEIIQKGKYPVRLLVNLKGYAIPAQATVTVNVEETKAVVKLDSNVIRLRAVPEEATDTTETRGRYAYLPLTISENLKGKNIDNIELQGDYSNVFDIRGTEDNQGILIKNTNTISGKQDYNIAIRYEGAAKDVVIPVTIQAVSENSNYRLSEKSVKINRMSVDQPYAKVKISGAADNDVVNIDRYVEVIRGKETSPSNVYVTYEKETGMFTIQAKSYTGKFKLKIYPEGSDRALTLSVKVYNKYPKFKVNKSKITLNTQTRETQTIYITNNGGVSNGFNYYIKNKYNYSTSVGQVSVVDGCISITPYSTTPKGKYKLYITPYNGGGKTLKVNLTVSDKAPKFKITPGKVKLNSTVSHLTEQVELTIKATPSAYIYENFTFYQIDKYGRKNSVKDFDITKGTDGKIYINRKSDNVEPGTYKIQAVSQNFNKVKPMTFKIVVENKAITFKQKGITLLNSNIVNQAEKSKINFTTSANLSNVGEFKFYEKTGNSLGEVQNVIITKESDGYYVALSDSSKIKSGTINLVAKSLTYENAKDVNIKIKVSDKKPVMNAAFTGKIDSVDPASYIDVKLTMKDTSIRMSNEGKISIDNVNFSLYRFRPEENTVRIRLNSNADLGAANAKTAIITYEDVHGNKVETGKITIPVTTSKVTLKAEKSLYEIYRADKTDEALIKLLLDGTAGAVIDSVEFANEEDAAKFAIRCVSKATRKYAIGIIDERAVEVGNYKVKLNVKVRGVVKTMETVVNLEVK